MALADVVTNRYVGTDLDRLASEKVPAIGEIGFTERGMFVGDGETPGSELTPVLTQADLAGNDEVIDAVVALVQSAAGLTQTKLFAVGNRVTDGAMWMDRNKRFTKLGVDIFGEVSDTTVDSLFGKGVPRAKLVQDATGLAFFDVTGTKRLALGFNKLGQFDLTMKWALANLMHEYTGTDRPELWPPQPDGSGGYMRWNHTDGKGKLINVQRGVWQ